MQENSLKVLQKNHERFSDRQLPDRRHFLFVYQQLSENGEMCLLTYFNSHPSNSTGYLLLICQLIGLADGYHGPQTYPP